jgi:hypothetical protein
MTSDAISVSRSFTIKDELTSVTTQIGSLTDLRGPSKTVRGNLAPERESTTRLEAHLDHGEEGRVRSLLLRSRNGSLLGGDRSHC